MKTFCIYTNSFTNDPNTEHIIPFSLGGHKEFVIDVDRKFNSDIGSKVDGKLADDFLVLFERDRADAKGHSRKHPKPIVKSANLDDGSPIQAIFGADGLEIFDLKTKSKLPKSISRGRIIECRNIKVDIDIDLMFVAKVALAAGYYAYGNAFKDHVDTDEFRKIMNLDKANFPTESNARVYNRFHNPDANDDTHHILKMLTEMGSCSTVIMAPSSDSFGVAVSILGKFLGFISVPSKSQYLPNESDYRYGHCVYIQNNQLKRCSFDHARLKLLDLISDSDDYQCKAD